MTRWPAVGALAASSSRARRGSLLGLVALVAILGGVAMGSVAAARRTDAAYPAYLAASRASNLQVSIYYLASSSGAVSSSGITAELAGLPGVAHVAASPSIYLFPHAPAGSRETALFTRNYVQAEGSVGGEAYQVDRPVVVQGRMANPHDPYEIVASRDAAALLRWHVGERVEFDLYSLAQAEHSSAYPPKVRPVAHLTLTLVGTVVFANEIARDDVDRYPTYVLTTPALTHRLGGIVGVTNYELSLRGGAASTAAVERHILALLPLGSVYTFHETSVVEGQVQRAVRPEVIALGAFGAIAAAAALLLSAQALRREIGSRRREFVVARALGADQATLTLAAALGPVAATSVGAALAALIAVLLSPMAPFDPVRLVDPSPGFAADWTVLLIGTLGMMAVLCALGALFGATLARGVASPAATLMRRSRVADTAARLGLSIPVVAGLRFALERGSGRTAVPVRSALVAAVVAVTVAVTTVTFAQSLATLASRPALYGWGWNEAIISPGGGNVPPIVRARLSADPLVSAWTGFSYADAQIDGTTVPILRGSAHQSFGPPVLQGHGLEGVHQIVLGPETMAALHRSVGQVVTLTYGTKADCPVCVPPTQLRIVGTATMPAIGGSGTLHTSMGVGAELTDAAAPAAFRRAISQPDPNLNGPNIAVVRLRPGVSHAAGVASLRAIAEAGTRTMARDPTGQGESFVVIGPQRPAEITVYESAGSTPALLAVALGVGAVAALGLALGASVRRRRRDLAMLKTLGLLRRQLAFAVGWQSTAVACIGVLFGVPVGIALGRWLWDEFAATIAAVPDPTVPVVEVFAIVVATVMLANLVAALPGRVAARTPAALVLRSE